MTVPPKPPTPAIEQPILWVGMSGFPPEQRRLLERYLERPAGLPCWRVSRFGEADAWLVNGSKVRVMPDGSLKVSPGLPTEQSLRLDLSAVDRPIAFGTPIGFPDFEPRYTFDPGSQVSIQGVLLQFETWLRHVRSQFVLGSQLILLGSQLRHGVFHVSHRGRLLAILDFRQGKAGLSPGAHPADLHEARWDKRPIAAGDIPESFIRTSPAELTWTYVRRTDREMLPARYRAETIYFRGAPKVPLRWLRDSQLMLLHELSADPSDWSALRQRTGFAESQMNHDLTCLYYAGAITTTRAKAARAVARNDSLPQSSGPELGSVLHEESRHYAGDITVPASLEFKQAAASQGHWASG